MQCLKLCNMPYTNDTKPTSSFSNDTKPSLASAMNVIGNPIGLLLALTYAVVNYGPGEEYTNDTEPTSSYSNDTKP